VASPSHERSDRTDGTTERSDAVVLADTVRMVSRATVSATRTNKGLPTLPEAQVAVLHTLRASPALTPAELAQQLDLARPTVSNLLRDLDAAGYLVREPSEIDRRSVTLTITEQARTVQDAFRRGRVEVVTAAWAALSENDRAALITATPALRRLADLLLGTTHRSPREARQ